MKAAYTSRFGYFLFIATTLTKLMNLRPFSSHWLNDALAGMVVFLVALPLCLGIANASGVEPFAGLVAGIIGGLVVACLSGSRLSVSGPAAGLVVIVIDGIADLGSLAVFGLAVLLSGLIQLGFGLAKAGRFAAYVPSPVIKGMLAAIGILLITKQLPQAFGLINFNSIPAYAKGFIATPFGWISLSTCVIAALSLALLVGWETRALRRFFWIRALPAPLLAALFGIASTLILSAFAPAFAPLAEHRVVLPSIESLATLGATLQLPDFGPDFSQLATLDVWRVAFTLALVASLETLLSLEAVEQIDPKHQTPQPDRELKAQGVGNFLSGLVGGLPITSVIVRSSVNVYAGAQSRLSAFIHGVLLLISIFALTDVINLMPHACLAAILIATGMKLAKPSLVISMARQGTASFVPFLVTLIGVITTDLLIGIVLGLLCSALIALYANLQRPIMLAQHDDHYLIAFRKDVSFLGKVSLKHYLKLIPDGATLIIDETRADFVDNDVRELIDTFVANAPHRAITIDLRQHVKAKRKSAYSLVGGHLNILNRGRSS